MKKSAEQSEWSMGKPAHSDKNETTVTNVDQSLNTDFRLPTKAL